MSGFLLAGMVKCDRRNEAWISFLVEHCCNASSSMKHLQKNMNYILFFSFFKGVDESGADKFTVLFPSGTPLPARRQHTLHAPGNISSVCLELYESLGKSPMNEEEKFAQVSVCTLLCSFNSSLLGEKNGNQFHQHLNLLLGNYSDMHFFGIGLLIILLHMQNVDLLCKVLKFPF